MKHTQQIGITLIELSVVLLILLALAGLSIPYLSGTGQKALCDATDVSMANIKRVIMDRYYLDTLGNFPVDKGNTDYSLRYLFLQGDGAGTDWSAFDPDTQLGWRGPYLMTSSTLTSESALMTNFTSVAGTYVHRAFVDNDYVVLDAWGRPIVLQVPTSASCDALTGLTGTANGYCARLVSAGPGSGVGIGKGDIDTPINDDAGTVGAIENKRQADDRVLYLQQTPAGEQNIPCGDL